MANEELNIVRQIANEEARKTSQNTIDAISVVIKEALNNNAKPNAENKKDLHDWAQDYVSRKGRGLGYIATLPSLAWEGVQYCVLMPITFLGDAILRGLLKKKTA